MPTVRCHLQKPLSLPLVRSEPWQTRDARFDSLNGPGIVNSYDALGRLASSTSSMNGTRTLDYDYDAAGRRTGITHPDATTVTFGYKRDPLGRLTAIHEGTSLTSSSSLVTYDYNNDGTLKSQTWGGSGTTGITTQTPQYDTLGRPSAISSNLPGTTRDLNSTFGYNPASQISSRDRNNNLYAWTDAVSVNRGYSSNGLNQYLTAGPASFSYDANGNLTSDGATTFVYDVENRLVKATGAKTANLVYDPLGRLSEVNQGTSTTTTRFLYDDVDLVAEYNSSGSLLRRYVHGDALDTPVVLYEGTASLGTSNRDYLIPDERGSIVAVTRGNGTFRAANSYDAYGIPSSSNWGRFQYTGQVWLPELEMYHYKARIYSPTLGRFMHHDILGDHDVM